MDALVVEKPGEQALAGIEQGLRLIDAALVVLRSVGVELREQVAAEQIERIHERIEAAHTEIRLLDRQHQQAELVDGDKKLIRKPLRLCPQAAELLAHIQQRSGEVVDGRWAHAESVARAGR